jgi:hypothetical protein
MCTSDYIGSALQQFLREFSSTFSLIKTNGFSQLASPESILYQTGLFVNASAHAHKFSPVRIPAQQMKAIRKMLTGLFLHDFATLNMLSPFLQKPMNLYCCHPLENLLHPEQPLWDSLVFAAPVSSI